MELLEGVKKQDTGVVEESEQQEEISISRMENTDWCSCGKCTLMDSLEGNICWQEIKEYKTQMEEGVKCITEHQGFEPVGLNIYVLRVAHQHYSYKSTVTMDLSNKQLKFAAYKQLTRWIYAWLGKRN